MSEQQARSATPKVLPLVHPRAAGLDVGATFHEVAVPSERAEESVRTFRSFAADRYALATGLQDVGDTTISMESTGV